MKRILTTATALVLAAAVNAQTVKVDPDLASYTPVSGVSGNLNSIGSDTLNNLMTLWAESFQKHYPNVKIQIEGKGSSTAPPALIEGTAQLGPMSRPMKSAELDKFEKKFGYKPTQTRVAIDALAVFVHKDNPVKGLDMKQLDSVFSSTRKRGGEPVDTWGQAGLTGRWKNMPVSLYGRNSASGTYGYFKKVVCDKGDYRPTVKEQPGSSSVVLGVASELGGIGYSGIGYKTSSVRALALSDGGKLCEPSLENCLSGDYPLARFLYIYLNKRPGEKLDKLGYEFIRFVVSKQGQKIVVKDGYFPMPAAVAKEVLAGLR